MYEFEYTTRFRKDVRRAQKRGLDLELLFAAYDHLQATGELPAEYKAHPLRGKYSGCMDAHIKPDWVLIYELIETERVIVLHRTGTHQDVFSNY